MYLRRCCIKVISKTKGHMDAWTHEGVPFEVWTREGTIAFCLIIVHDLETMMTLLAPKDGSNVLLAKKI